MTATSETIRTDSTVRVSIPMPRHGGVSLDGRRNLLSDTLYEMGYRHDPVLVDILIEQDVVDFKRAEYTSHVMDDLIEHYGEEVLCGGLEKAIILENENRRQLAEARDQQKGE